MPSQTVQWVTEMLGELFACLSSDLEWKWDGRFDTALAEVSSDQANVIQARLEAEMASCLDAALTRGASEAIQQIVRRLGGLMPGQKLFASNRESTDFIFCAWWPWGNGQRVSIRIGFISQDLLAEEAASLKAYLQSLTNQ